jgi:ABC-type amino acid transport system permease subunit
MTETWWVFLSGTLFGTFVGLMLKRRIWPEAGIVDVLIGAISGSSLLSICMVILYGLVSEILQPSFLALIVLHLLPAFGAISFIRFIRNNTVP